MVPGFQNAEFQHAFSTRISWSIWLILKGSGVFCMLIQMHLTVFENFILLEFFPRMKFMDILVNISLNDGSRGLKFSA